MFVFIFFQSFVYYSVYPSIPLRSLLYTFHQSISLEQVGLLAFQSAEPDAKRRQEKKRRQRQCRPESSRTNPNRTVESSRVESIDLATLQQTLIQRHITANRAVHKHVQLSLVRSPKSPWKGDCHRHHGPGFRGHFLCLFADLVAEDEEFESCVG